MTGAIWSTPPSKCFLDFPAKTLIQFMYNHHLLQITGKPSCLTIEGGSHDYVSKILAKLPETQLHLSTPIVSAATRQIAGSSRQKVVLKTQEGDKVEYDHVIFACHSDTALEILKAGDITLEDRILAHASKSNGLVAGTTSPPRLRKVPEEYHRSGFSVVQAQTEMHKIQNKPSITFPGTWLKYGFHEDGFTSGLLAACVIDEEDGGYPTFSRESQSSVGAHV